MRKEVHLIQKTYEELWGKPDETHQSEINDGIKLDYPDLKTLYYAPTRLRSESIYATCGLSLLCSTFDYVSECFIFSYEKNKIYEVVLSELMNYVQTNELNYGTVFECLKEHDHDYSCRFLVAMFPLMDGGDFKEVFLDGKEVFFLWLLPICESEKKFIEDYGMDAFEEKFISSQPEFFSWDRKPVV